MGDNQQKMADRFRQKVVLHCGSSKRSGLDELVERFLLDGVKYVGVVGEECALVEDLIDEIVVGDGADESRFILTASHPNQSIEEAVAFAESLSDDYRGEVQVVELPTFA